MEMNCSPMRRFSVLLHCLSDATCKNIRHIPPLPQCWLCHVPMVMQSSYLNLQLLYTASTEHSNQSMQHFGPTAGSIDICLNLEKPFKFKAGTRQYPLHQAVILHIIQVNINYHCCKMKCQLSNSKGMKQPCLPTTTALQPSPCTPLPCAGASIHEAASEMHQD